MELIPQHAQTEAFRNPLSDSTMAGREHRVSRLRAGRSSSGGF
ncbi:hypothetical protein PORCRE_149 [Porphyromonas crevioricanis JCM 15906]|uniref:Uncharacterized protein n=1 Tax=Porphyromonas crevioricanis JCM 15906 TaxID=1305617 RepID=S4NB47_9PORP|nr:hypothetical protein PORCRE_149 [Porphyromonas crevioricanis JCM 15906]GAD07051.1 hypothetical protein PORCAN_664 [Porphyromonas crevioricanis JCM 13913]